MRRKSSHVHFYVNGLLSKFEFAIQIQMKQSFELRTTNMMDAYRTSHITHHTSHITDTCIIINNNSDDVLYAYIYRTPQTLQFHFENVTMEWER